MPCVFSPFTVGFSELDDVLGLPMKGSTGYIVQEKPEVIEERAMLFRVDTVVESLEEVHFTFLFHLGL